MEFDARSTMTEYPRRKKMAFCVREPSLSRNDWFKTRQNIICENGVCRLDGRRVKIAKKILNDVNPKDFVLSHATIIASVETQDGPDWNVKFRDYYIDPRFSRFVNDNSDAWERKLLWLAFPTFVGADNFMEHVQLKEFSRGVILDAVPRMVKIKDPDTGEELTVLYIDILVATHKSHESLCQGIISGEINKMSMGCSLDFTICTKCGKVIYDDDELCPCLENRGQYFIDENGIRRIIAELCGHHTYPTSCRFTEASWVDTPAYGGAVSRGIINLDQFKQSNPKLASKIVPMLKKALELQEYRREINKNVLKVASRMSCASNEMEIVNVDDIFRRIISEKFRR